MIQNKKKPTDYSKNSISKYKNELIFHIDFHILNTDYHHTIFKKLGHGTYGKVYEYLKYHVNILETAIFFENFETIKDYEIKSISHLSKIGIELHIILRIYKEIIAYSNEHLPLVLSKDIKNIYEKLIVSFDDITEEASKRVEVSKNLHVDDELYNKLISGDYESAKELFLTNVNDIESFILKFENKMVPILSKIGIEWELNNISVSKEHLAVNIINDIASNFFATLKSPQNTTLGSVLLCNIEGENHNLIINIINKIFQHNGYKTYNLNSSIPNNDLENFISTIPSLKYILFSCTLESNLINFYKLHKNIKNINNEEIITIAGGSGFNNIYNPRRVFNLDFYCNTLKQVLDITK